MSKEMFKEMFKLTENKVRFLPFYLTQILFLFITAILVLVFFPNLTKFLGIFVIVHLVFSSLCVYAASSKVSDTSLTIAVPGLLVAPFIFLVYLGVGFVLYTIVQLAQIQKNKLSGFYLYTLLFIAELPLSIALTVIAGLISR